MADLTFSGERSGPFELLHFEQRKQDTAWLRSHLEDLELLSLEKSDLKSKGIAFGFTKTLVHNDLLAGNLLLSNEVCEDPEDGITIIDYEYGSHNFRAFDLGNHFNGKSAYKCLYDLYLFAFLENCGYDMNLNKFPSRTQRADFASHYLSHLAKVEAEYRSDEFIDGFQVSSAMVYDNRNMANDILLRKSALCLVWLLI